VNVIEVDCYSLSKNGNLQFYWVKLSWDAQKTVIEMTQGG